MMTLIHVIVFSFLFKILAKLVPVGMQVLLTGGPYLYQSTTICNRFLIFGLWTLKFELLNHISLGCARDWGGSKPPDTKWLPVSQLGMALSGIGTIEDLVQHRYTQTSHGSVGSNTESLSFQCFWLTAGYFCQRRGCHQVRGHICCTSSVYYTVAVQLKKHLVSFLI